MVTVGRKATLNIMRLCCEVKFLVNAPWEWLYCLKTVLQHLHSGELIWSTHSESSYYAVQMAGGWNKLALLCPVLSEIMDTQ